MPVEPHIQLSDLNGHSFSKLVNILQKNESWVKVADFFQIYTQNEIAELSRSPCPANDLLNDFSTKLCTVETLSTALRHCELYDALAVLSGPEPMQVIRQPTFGCQNANKLRRKLGDPLELEFAVSGVPPPKFQWFKEDRLLTGQEKSVLNYERFMVDLEGEYYCRASQDGATSPVRSESVFVEAAPFACTILEQPEENVYLPEGSPVLLKIKAVGYPPPQYQWLHDNTVLDGQHKHVLVIKEANKSHSGEYRCFVSNRAGETVVKTNLMVHSKLTFPVYNGVVSHKTALLIANEDYASFANLNSASNDVATIAQILNTLGFNTLCLQNLTLGEMNTAVEIFADLVDEESFAFFYYAGHGFKVGDKFLIPVDCPSQQNLRKVDALPESKILQKVLRKNPVLFVHLLDMCLKMPNRTTNPQIYEEVLTPFPYESNRNLIMGHSTANHLGSYERKGSDNGVYTSVLKKHLGENLPILTILGNVNSEITSVCPRQTPTITHVTAREFYLNKAVKEPPRDSIYASLDVHKEYILVNGAELRVGKFKETFQNVLQVDIVNCEEAAYNLNLPPITVQEIINDKEVKLILKSLQKLENPLLNINLIVNRQKVTILKQIGLALYFK